MNGKAVSVDPKREDAARGRTASRVEEGLGASASSAVEGPEPPRERQIAPTVKPAETQSMPDIQHEISEFPTLQSPVSENHITFSPDTRPRHSTSSPDTADRHGIYVLQHLIPRDGVGARTGSHNRTRSISNPPRVSFERPPHDITEKNDVPVRETQNSFFRSGILSRNSTFHHMNEDDRERLGGIEYKAVRLLAWLVPAYFVLWQLFGCLALGAWVATNNPATARMNGLNPWWVGAFNAVSAFNNSGMSLLDANMVAFQTSVFMLISMGLFILAGNTWWDRSAMLSDQS
jgi:hypothetical protein